MKKKLVGFALVLMAIVTSVASGCYVEGGYGGGGGHHHYHHHRGY